MPIIKKFSNLLDKEIPLLSSLYPNMDLAEIGKRKPLKATILGLNPSRSI
jgi:hypothetical protein